MTFSFGLGLGGRSGGSSSVYDPAVLSLNGWWRGSFSASPWVGVASAGASGTRDLTEATNPPAAGTTVNGYAPADFDGTNDVLGSGLTLDDFINAGSWSAFCVFYADAAFTSAGVGTRYLNPSFLVEGVNSYFRIGFSDEGIEAINNAGTELVIACATGAWNLLSAKYDGTNLKLRLNGGTWSSTASTNTPDLTGTPMRVGVRYDGGTTFFNGKILDLGVCDSALSDGVFDSILGYARTRYALALA